MKSDDAPAIAPRIFAFRGESVMLDSDLAILYGVETKVFNQALKRNTHRFPSDFAFQLQREEFASLRSQIVTSSSPGGRRKLPWVFTEHGAIMAAILNSERAVAMKRRERNVHCRAAMLAVGRRKSPPYNRHDSALRDVI